MQNTNITTSTMTFLINNHLWIWKTKKSKWRLAVGGWLLAFGGWRLAVGGWRLAVGGWRLAVGGWRLAFDLRNDWVVSEVKTTQFNSYPVSH